ncbi:hypothetical protein DKX38_025123 [Salix brachista]|uniref:Uncharacterized protein n=1 Tax=Salix brachista TaxID=2182728 RepID=A0A5N5JS00_9ROSI|nr:hypothetical protein DKX38_025123 [Salix brachista]
MQPALPPPNGDGAAPQNHPSLPSNEGTHSCCRLTCHYGIVEMKRDGKKDFLSKNLEPLLSNFSFVVHAGSHPSDFHHSRVNDDTSRSRRAEPDMISNQRSKEDRISERVVKPDCNPFRRGRQLENELLSNKTRLDPLIISEVDP